MAKCSGTQCRHDGNRMKRQFVGQDTAQVPDAHKVGFTMACFFIFSGRTIGLQSFGVCFLWEASSNGARYQTAQKWNFAAPHLQY